LTYEKLLPPYSRKNSASAYKLTETLKGAILIFGLTGRKSRTALKKKIPFRFSSAQTLEIQIEIE